MYPTYLPCIICLVAVAKAYSNGDVAMQANGPFSWKAANDGLAQNYLTADAKIANLTKSHVLFNFFQTLATADPHTPPASSKCFESYRRLLQDFSNDEKYAIQVIDSWGKLGSGVLLGNLEWMGRYHECEAVRTTQFVGKYFFIKMKIKSPFPMDRNSGIGICLPKSCSITEAKQIVSPIEDHLHTKLDVTSPAIDPKYTAADILAIIITSIFVCLVIAGSIYDYYLSHIMEQLDDEHGLLDAENPQELSVFSRLCLSFSIMKNTRTLLDTTHKEGNINILHGLRFFSMTWVILGHTFTLGSEYIENGLDAGHYLVNNWSFQTIADALFSVDSFYFLSGLLGGYLGLREMRKRNGKLNVLLMYANRYLRLTPAYAFCILINVSIYKKFGDGPKWPATIAEYAKPCEKYWWTNLIYINNFYPISMRQGCFSWGWYLANEMQFYILLPLLLYLIYRRPWVGTGVLHFGVLASMVSIGVLATHFKTQPFAVNMGYYFYYALRGTYPDVESLISVPDFAKNTTTFQQTNIRAIDAVGAGNALGVSNFVQFWSDTYAKPWSRMGAYFVGVFTGLVLYSYNTRVRMNKIVALIGWIAAFGVGLALVYGLYGDIEKGKFLPFKVSSFYKAVCRPMWAFCLAWVVVACSGGYGGPITVILSWKALIPLSRLTYCAYLVHPMVIYWLYGTMETKMHFNIPLVAVLYAGITPISYAIAYVVSMLVEMPMIGITKTLFEKVRTPEPPGPLIPQVLHNQLMEDAMRGQD